MAQNPVNGATGFLALVAAGLLTGCAAVPPSGDRPQPISAEALGAATPFADAQGAWPDAAWWRAFRDPQLEALVDEALQASPDLAAAQARLDQARALAQGAAASRMPQVAGEARVLADKQSYNDGIPPQFVPRGYNDRAALGLTLAYDLDLAGAARQRARAALGEANAAEVEMQAARISIASAVASGYVELARLAAERASLQDLVQIRADNEALIAARVGQGLDLPARLAQAKALSAAARADLAGAEAAVDGVRNALAALLGKGPDRGRDIAIPDNLGMVAQGLPASVPLDLVGRRPDVVAARLRVEAATDRASAARASFFPSINLMGLIGFRALGIGNLLDSGSDVGNIGPALSLPIFDGGRLRANYRGSLAQRDLAVADYNRTVVSAASAVADALAVQRAATAQFDEAEQALAQTVQAHDTALRRRAVGLADQLSLLASKDALRLSRLRRAEAQATRLTAEIALIRALGGGFGPVTTPIR